ncbi:MAG: hypothetical protein HY042_12375 [Spirochaetia bacterium]|nr:hypothetical protein [Spirochaetia bacterium]
MLHRFGASFKKTAAVCGLFLFLPICGPLFAEKQVDKGGHTAADSKQGKQKQDPAGEPSGKPSGAKDPGLTEFRREAKFILGDGRSVKGVLVFSAVDKIMVNHIHAGVNYHKELRPADILSVDIKKWRGRETKQVKDGRVFEFHPYETQVLLRDGTTVSPSEFFGFFRKLNIESANGRVALFTFWVDLLKENGSWYTGMTGSQEKPRTTCHKDVVKRIEFLDQE